MRITNKAIPRDFGAVSDCCSISHPSCDGDQTTIELRPAKQKVGAQEGSTHFMMRECPRLQVKTQRGRLPAEFEADLLRVLCVSIQPEEIPKVCVCLLAW